MPQKTSVIRCPKCGYEPNLLTDTCIKCHAELEKLCGTCGFSNAVEKNYCDKCGGLLTLKPGAARSSAESGNSPDPAEPPANPRIEMQPIQDTVTEQDTSSKGPASPPAAPQPAAAGQNQETTHADARHTAQADDLSRSFGGPADYNTSKAPEKDSGPGPKGRDAKLRLSFKKYEMPLFGLAVAVAALVVAYALAEPRLPGFILKRAAANYLDKLSAGRYREAYDLLSTNSKSVCPLEDYIKQSTEYYSKFPRWQFKDIAIFSINKNGAMIKYRLREGNKPWQDDYISFVRENGKWTRPYIWTLFAPIDSALESQDFPQALFLAQKLYLTDPIDPRTSGYLCTSEFFMGIYNKSAESCIDSLNASKTYPVGFSPEEIFWYRFY